MQKQKWSVHEQMFDYVEFTENVVKQMKDTFQNWLAENDDIYILSLDCARGADSIGMIANTDSYLYEQVDEDSDDFWYYKYCEDEWELFEAFEEISGSMRGYLEENKAAFTNLQTSEYTEAFESHCAKIIESCLNAALRFGENVRADFPDLMLNVNVREYLDGEEREEIFAKLNNESSLREYAEHINEFI